MRSADRDGRSCRRVSPFRDLRIDARLPAPRRFSQAAASFVASRCQDIHHAPLRAWPHLPIAGGKGVLILMNTCRRRNPPFCFFAKDHSTDNEPKLRQKGARRHLPLTHSSLRFTLDRRRKGPVNSTKIHLCFSYRSPAWETPVPASNSGRRRGSFTCYLYCK